MVTVRTPTTRSAPKPVYKTFEDVAAACNSYDIVRMKDPETTPKYYTLQLQDQPNYIMGMPHPDFAKEVKGTIGWKVDDDNKIIILLGKTPSERTKILNDTLIRLRDEGRYLSLNASSWADELMVFYGPDGQEAGRIERSGANITGVLAYAIHITAYYIDKADKMWIWVPRRGPNKSLHPNKLDCTVGGGIGVSDDATPGDLNSATVLSAHQTALKEAEEEASFSEEVMKSLELVDILHCAYIRTRPVTNGQKTGDYHTQWSMMYVYDLQLDQDTVPEPGEGESHVYELMSPERYLEAIYGGEFKPNSAALAVHFLFRHGKILPKEYEGVDEHLHRPFIMPVSREVIDSAKRIGKSLKGPNCSL